MRKIFCDFCGNQNEKDERIFESSDTKHHICIPCVDKAYDNKEPAKNPADG